MELLSQENDNKNGKLPAIWESDGSEWFPSAEENDSTVQNGVVQS